MRFHIQSAMAKVAGEMWSKATGKERKAAYRADKKNLEGFTIEP